jgi:hypothetical protein
MTDLPADAIDAAERLTRRARRTADEAEAARYRDARAELLADYGYSARVREDGDGAVLVLHPDEWLADGVAQMEQIDDLDRGIERPLDRRTTADDWAAIDEHNQDVADAVATAHGPVHAANVVAFATYMSNHHERRLETATSEEIDAFLKDYFQRNAWPSSEQRECVEESIELAFEIAAEPLPTEWSRSDS